MRSITNVYMLSLCWADFIYLTNLSLVAATQLNDKSWPFGSLLCTLYHGTETTGKYASVMFVVLLAADRYCAMCKANLCAKYRNYRTAVCIYKSPSPLSTPTSPFQTCLSLLAWMTAMVAASPLYVFSEVVVFIVKPPAHRLQSLQLHPPNYTDTKLCLAKWPSPDMARWYIAFSSVFIFVVPLVVITFCSTTS